MRALDGPWRVGIVMAVVSMVLWRRVVAAPTTVSVGVGARDFHFYVWSLDIIARGLFRWGPALRTSVVYPVEGGVPLTSDTTILGFAFLLAPVTRVFGAVFSLNVVMLSAIPLNAAASFWAYRKVLRTVLPGALLGALLFSTSPFVMGHSQGHANLVHVWWLPLSAGLLVPAAVCEGGRRRSRLLRGAAGGGVLGFAMLISSELVAIAAVVIVPWLAVIVLRRRPTIHIAPLVAAALCAATLSAPVVWGTLGDGNRYTGAHQPSNVYVTDAANLLVPTGDSMIGRILGVGRVSNRWTGNAAETTGFVSVFGLALMVIALERRVGAASRGFAALGAWALVLSFGPFLHVAGLVTGVPLLPGMVLAVLPVLTSVLPGRVSLVVVAALGATIAQSFATREEPPLPDDAGNGPDREFRRMRNRLCRVLAAATVVCALPPLTMPSFAVQSRFGRPSLTRDACGTTGSTSRAVAVPRSEAGYDALTWQARGGFQVELVRARYFLRTYPLHGRVLLLDAYVHDGPAEVFGRTPVPGEGDQRPAPEQVFAQLRALGVDCVVTAPGLMDRVAGRRLGALFGASVRSRGLAYWSVDPTTT